MIRRTVIAFAALALLTTSGSAIAAADIKRATEEDCRNREAAAFDELMLRTCPDNLSRGLGATGVCSDIITMRNYFVPTKRIPDLAAFRTMWIEYRTEICMRVPQGPGYHPGEGK
jgi:hypothetical protein